MNGRSVKQEKHRRRRHHQLAQKYKRKEALAQAAHDAEFIGASGQTLKKPRKKDSGAYDKAFNESMRKAGYSYMKKRRRVRVSHTNEYMYVFVYRWEKVYHAEPIEK